MPFANESHRLNDHWNFFVRFLCLVIERKVEFYESILTINTNKLERTVSNLDRRATKEPKRPCNAGDIATPKSCGRKFIVFLFG